jgi:hypothetical protein
VKQVLVASAIVVIGALVLWGRVLAHPIGSGGSAGAPFAPLRFAIPVAIAALAYQSLMQPWLAREGARPIDWVIWTIFAPLAIVAAALLAARQALELVFRLAGG